MSSATSSPVTFAWKSVSQRYAPTNATLKLMDAFRNMTNDATRLGLTKDMSSLKRLSSLIYRELANRYDIIPSYYRLCAISKAAGILASRKKSMRRGFLSKEPRLHRSFLTSCYGFKVENGALVVPLGGRQFERIPLTSHTLACVSQPGVRVRSFTLTEKSLSLSIAKEIRQIEPEHFKGAVGIDRNLRNITVGNGERVTVYDTNNLVQIAENTAGIIRSFKRNDFRIRRKLASKYGRRRDERTEQTLHRVSKHVVRSAMANKHVIVFEEITGIRKLYRKGNSQGRSFRGRMNAWPFFKLKRQVEYKAAWEGIPVVTLTKSETRGT